MLLARILLYAAKFSRTFSQSYCFINDRNVPEAEVNLGILNVS